MEASKTVILKGSVKSTKELILHKCRESSSEKGFGSGIEQSERADKATLRYRY